VIEGDSGAWVAHNAAPEVYGHVVATDILGDAYVMPSVDTLEEIRDCLAAKYVELPHDGNFCSERTDPDTSLDDLISVVAPEARNVSNSSRTFSVAPQNVNETKIPVIIPTVDHSRAEDTLKPESTDIRLSYTAPNVSKFQPSDLGLPLHHQESTASDGLENPKACPSIGSEDSCYDIDSGYNSVAPTDQLTVLKFSTSSVDNSHWATYSRSKKSIGAPQESLNGIINNASLEDRTSGFEEFFEEDERILPGEFTRSDDGGACNPPTLGTSGSSSTPISRRTAQCRPRLSAMASTRSHKQAPDGTLDCPGFEQQALRLSPFSKR
jgi:hypothetical protein